MEKLNKLHEEVNTLFAKFNKDHADAVAGNKSAARRARVVSVQIRKALQEYLAESGKA